MNNNLILIIDDSKFNIKVLETYLGDKYDIISATEGQQGIELAKERKPDLILLDIIMPELSGFEVCELLKKDEETKNIAIIFITGASEQENELNGLRLGAIDYIHKPFSIPLIQARIATHIELIKSKQALALKSQTKEAYLDAIINNSGEGIITINTEGIIEMINPKAAHIFGYEIEELVGKNVSVLVPMPERQHHDAYVQRSELYETRVFDNMRELQGEHKDGSFFSLELNVTPMVINRERKFIGMVKDISERKRFIDELLIAKAQAETSNKAKSQFLASMSHELRTPLNAILGFTQLMQTDPDFPPAPEQLESLNYVYNAGKQLLALITDVLKMAELESDSSQIVFEISTLAPLISQCIKEQHALASQYQILLEFSAESDAIQTLAIETDKLKLKQVINHLLSNAIKYNKPHGSVQIIVEDLGNSVRISVSDTGLGIPEHSWAQLFKPFSRLGAEVGTIDGAGIGLTMSKKIIEMLKGKIGMHSAVNQGSTFWIELAKHHR